MKKYICPVESYPNCRVHDGGFSAGVQFFETAEELRAWTLRCMSDYAIEYIYDLDGNEGGLIKYELSGHRCSGINLYIEGEFWKVADDGSGNKRWVKEDRSESQ